MYIDKSIQLPKLPRLLARDIQELSGYYETGDETSFLLLEETVCSAVKQAVIDNQISREDGLKIFAYFGWR